MQLDQCPAEVTAFPSSVSSTPSLTPFLHPPSFSESKQRRVTPPTSSQASIRPTLTAYSYAHSGMALNPDLVGGNCSDLLGWVSKANKKYALQTAYCNLSIIYEL